MTKINEISQGILSFLQKKTSKQDLAAVVKNLKRTTEEQTALLEVTSAVPLNSVQTEKLKLIFAKRLKSNFKIKNKQVCSLRNKQVCSLRNKIDKNIIAGLIIRYKDFLVDESIAGRLEFLRKSANGY